MLRSQRRGRFALLVFGAAAGLLVGAPTAAATFHEMMIREVYPGSASSPDAEYVELQMWAAGQNLVEGHAIALFNATGKPVGSATFGADVSGKANQSTLLAATPAAVSEFGIAADVELPSGSLDPSGGAVCWESLDCVAWGNFTGSVNSPVGPPAAPSGIPDGMALRRMIAPGCPTLLESSDDHDNSAADFSTAFPAPRPNSVTPSERACAIQPVGTEAGGGNPEGGAVGAARQRPQTKIRRHPGHATRDRTPTFGFSSSIPGSTFLCKLDRGSFRRCHSPLTAPPLGSGHHLFKVKASAPGDTTDPSAATYGFTVLESQHVKHP